MKKNIKWTYEKLKESANRFKSVKEWRTTESSAYVVASQRKLLKELTKDMHKIGPKGFWTKENVKKSARKYSHKVDWIKSEGGAYRMALKKNWLDEVCKHMIPLGNKKKRMIYSIEIINHKMVYVGLTGNIKRRFRDHLKTKRFLEFKKKFGNKSLKLNKLSDYIDSVDAQKLEQQTIDRYKDKGFYILNKARPGSLGGIDIEWTKESIMNDSQKFTSVKQWIDSKSGSYAAASAKGIIDDVSNHMSRMIKKPGSWTKKEIIKISKEFKTITEWNQKDRKSYAAAQRLRLLEDDEVVGHFLKGEVINRKWTEHKVLINSKLYNSKSEWKRRSAQAYKAAKSFGIFERCIKHMARPEIYNKKWTKQLVIQEAKKYKTKSQWRNESGGSYSFAQKNKIKEEASTHMKILNPKGKWSIKEKVIENALKFKNKAKWNKCSSGAYESAKRNGWFKEATKHMLRPEINLKWTKEKIKSDALKYKTRTEWARKSAGAYESAKTKGIFDYVTKHMILRGKK